MDLDSFFFCSVLSWCVVNIRCPLIISEPSFYALDWIGFPFFSVCSKRTPCSWLHASKINSEQHKKVFPLFVCVFFLVSLSLVIVLQKKIKNLRNRIESTVYDHITFVPVSTVDINHYVMVVLSFFFVFCYFIFVKMYYQS